jgi:hypothetical protein
MKAYSIYVEYVHAAPKKDKRFCVLADDEAAALRMLLDSGEIGSGMSAFNISTSSYAAVIYKEKSDPNAILSVPGKKQG